jgi:hypothetical protein
VISASDGMVVDKNDSRYVTCIEALSCRSKMSLTRIPFTYVHLLTVINTEISELKSQRAVSIRIGKKMNQCLEVSLMSIGTWDARINELSECHYLH